MTVKLLKYVEIFTDGACRGNPGPGGWGAVLRCNGQSKHIYGGELHTTNNRMELMAVIKALAVLQQACDVEVTTDSQYVHKGITQWLSAWKRRQWKTSDNKPVKNVDLWQRLESEIARHQVRWQWVRGHQGHAENELADQLAKRGIDEQHNGL